MTTRQDKRGPLEIRPINFESLERGKANARCLFESKTTKIICAIYGPSHTRQQKSNPECELKIDLNMHNNSHYKKQQQNQKETPEQEKYNKYILQLRFQLLEILQSVICLQEYQKTNITIILDILENDGDLFSPIVNLLNFSLNLSGLKLVNQFSACIAYYCYKSEQAYLDPTQQELQEQADQEKIFLQIVTLANSHKIIYFKLSNQINSKTIYEKLFSAALSICQSVSQFSQQAIEKYYDNLQQQQQKQKQQ